MILLSALHCFILFMLASCIATKSALQANNVEVIDYTIKHYEPSATDLTKPFWILKSRVWFTDSLAIEEVRELNLQEDGKGNRTYDYAIRHYRFSDLRKHVIYEYKSFSDTASLIRKYLYDDSVKVIGGWGFNYIRNRDANSKPLADTIIENISYRRIRAFIGTEEFPYFLDCYFRCDKKGTIFDLNPSFSRKTVCPLVKTHHYSPLKKGLHITSEISFIADTLSPPELIVFNAWKKNAEESPANKK